MTIEERTRLILAPVGTPGLAELGLDDPEYADLANLGPRAIQEIAELQRAALVTRLSLGGGLGPSEAAALLGALGGAYGDR
jgi:hypothetical protein